jgi:hypothetical protein
MVLDRIKSLLETCSTDDTHFPPTDLYNEGWMLRLVLDWLHHHQHKTSKSLIPFPEDAHWYSEALLPSAFLPEKRGDPLAEAHTHADGVIGNFSIGSGAKGDLALLAGARCFVVIEAKMFSKLSPGVTNDRLYNQAARNVACMAYVLGEAGIQPEAMDALAFYVVAPQSQIDDGVFLPEMTREHIGMTVKRRVDAYEGRRDGWFKDRFLPLFERVDIRTIAWEQLVSEIRSQDATYGAEMEAFYECCLKFNRAVVLPTSSQ